MGTGSTLNQLRGTLEALHENAASIEWSDRRQIPEKAAAVIEAKPSAAQVTVAGDLLGTLAHDPKWEVRKAVADALRGVPGESYGGVLAQLSNDENAFVRQAAESAIERRRTTPVANRRRHTGPPIGERLAAIERRFGPEAARMARAIGESYYDELVGATAHDVRGILTPVGPQIERVREHVRDGSLTGQEARTLESVQSRLNLLQRMVSDMLDYSTPIRNGRRPERLDQIVAECVDLACAEMEARGVCLKALKVAIDVDPRHVLTVARAQFLRAIINVVRNAIEAAAESGKDRQRVDIVVASVGEEMHISIEDTGPGIAPADLADLRSFVPGRKTKKSDGTGFGLPIAHRMISGHGGSLEIESEVGRGSLIRIIVPREMAGGDA